MAEKKSMTKAAEEYLRQRSQEMGDTEFVGDLFDHYSSDRFYGETASGNGWPYAGAPADMGPLNPEGTRVDPYYAGYLTKPVTQDRDLSAKSYAPSGYSDPRSGLVKLGLYGGSWDDPIMFPGGLEGLEDVAGNYYDIPEGERGGLQSGLFQAKDGDADRARLVNQALQGTYGEEITERYGFVPGHMGMYSERPGEWVGGITTEDGLLSNGDDSKFGYYSLRDDGIRIDPRNDANVRETLAHELSHRGLAALSNLNEMGDPRIAEIEQELGMDFDDKVVNKDASSTSWITPPGKKLSLSDLMTYSGRHEGGDSGAYVEHNLIDAASRNRNNRYLYEGHEFDGDTVVGVNPGGYEDYGRAYGMLGQIANEIVNKQQKKNYEWVKNMRNQYDSPRVYGGKSGTALHPLLEKAGY